MIINDEYSEWMDFARFQVQFGRLGGEKRLIEDITQAGDSS